jgi:hypothetical protein
VNNSTPIFSSHNNQGFQVGSNTSNIHITLTGMLYFLYRLTKVKAKSALENLLHHLPYAAQAPFDSLLEAEFDATSKQHSPSCFENTRRNVLEQIEK